MKKLISCFLHGLLFSGVSPVILYVVNPDARIYIQPVDILRTVVFSIALYIVIALVAYLIVRDPRPAGLIAALLTLGLLHLLPFFVLGVVLVLAGIGVNRMLHRKLGYPVVHNLLMFSAVVLTGYYLAHFSAFLVRQPWNAYRSLVSPVIAASASPAPSGSPDIYYIILDGYGRADVLESLYGIDNSEFVQALEARGFFIGTASQANYPRTVLSLSSSLNMQYLDAMSSGMGDSELWWPAEQVMHYSLARSFLESAGYRTVFVASGFDYTDLRDGDVYSRPFPLMLNDFEETFFRFTNLSAFQGLTSRWVSHLSVENQRRIVLNGFSSLSEAGSIPGPKFVFAHIIAPHPPFVFDANGDLPANGPDTTFLGDADEFRGDPAQYRSGYAAQLQFVNVRILAVVDDILANSAVPPVIVIQGDHGPGLYTDFNSAAATCLWERYSILNAYLLPGVDPGSIPAGISPVNSFRLVFNTYFQTRLELLPDRSYFSGRTHFYQFEDVTGQTEAVCGQPAPSRP